MGGWSEAVNRIWAILLAVAALCFAAGPILFPGFRGFDPAAFPVPQTEPPVQPAGYAFAIWGLIYLWLLAGTSFGLFYRWNDEDWAAMRPTLFASLALGAFWLPVAATAPVVASVMLWAMLAFALWSLFRAGDTDRWWQLAPVAIYTGWLTAASGVALGLLLGGFDIVPETIAALIALTVTLVVSVVAQYRLHRAPEYGLAVIWALVGVVVANWQPLNVAVAGLAGLGIFAILALRGTDTE